MISQLVIAVVCLQIALVYGACPKIYSRSEWGARPATSSTYLNGFPKRYAFIHHSAGSTCTSFSACAAAVRGYQNYHMNSNGWNDIGYSFVVGGDGSIFEGRGWDIQGAHTANHNSEGFAVISIMISQLVIAVACLQVALVYGACPRIYSRSEWGARPAKSITYLHGFPKKYAFIHHSAGSTCTSFSACAAAVRGYQNYHMDSNGWSDVGYSFVVGGDGSIFEGRGWDKQGAHTANHNSEGFGISVSGNFMTHLPSTAAMNAVKSLLACGVSLGKLSPSYILRGHRDMNPTLCPGDKFYAEIKTWPHY